MQVVQGCKAGPPWFQGRDPVSIAASATSGNAFSSFSTAIEPGGRPSPTASSAVTCGKRDPNLPPARHGTLQRAYVAGPMELRGHIAQTLLFISR